ncbi:negative transcriptional regulator, PaiB family [Thiothrix eikelboomii]|uniref:Negative transcriptional regulator, PaiB family n=1 Tax=Thiothrix eikelboomii TaxID=92487 RepID=A0A1T4W5X8_9GAMM|nr:FMN-binding negative transcriptional regulator [Thiothrix eikelboomii]SKA72539.1 negative transcriptional regulator, PaiB family [Thiothrix eikelboomii]
MYVPKHFEQSDPQVLQNLIRSSPLASLVTLGAQGLNANPIPLYFEANGGLGLLQGHVARANPIWRDFDTQLEALVIFHGNDAYISPNWYPSKTEHGKEVPTWNYSVLNVYGHLRVQDDPLWLREFLEKLTQQQELGLAKPWQMSDAPDDYLQTMLKAIVGIELEITRWEGKWKLSQNKPSREYQGVIEGLNQTQNAKAIDLATVMKNLRTAH